MPKSGKLWLVITVGLAINLGLLLFYYVPSPKQLIGDEIYYYQQALLLASGQRIPYNLLWPPLYGEWVGFVFSILGTQVLYVQIIQIGLWLASAFIFSQIVSKMAPSNTVQGVSIALFILSPELITFSHYLWPETVHLFLWLSSLWFLICRPFTWLNTALAGVLLGCAILTKSLLGPFVLAILVFLFLLNAKISKEVRLINVSLFSAMIIAVTFPLMINNLIEREAFLVANSSVFNLWVGLNDVETADSVNDIAAIEMEHYLQSGPDLKTRNTVFLEKVVKKIKQQGLFSTLSNQLDKQYFRLFDVQTYFTTQLTGSRRQAYSANSTIVNRTLKLYSYTVYGFILATGASGLCFLRLSPLGWPHFFALFIAYNLGIFLFLHVKTRYTVQFLPMLIFFASIAVHGFINGRKSGQILPGFVFNRVRMGLGVFVGFMMSYISFYNLIFK